MNFKTYYQSIPLERREAFASACKTSKGHLQNVAGGWSTCSPALAVLIEKNSSGACTRQDIFPEDFPEIWPELAQRAKRSTKKPEAMGV